MSCLTMTVNVIWMLRTPKEQYSIMDETNYGLGGEHMFPNRSFFLLHIVKWRFLFSGFIFLGGYGAKISTHYIQFVKLRCARHQ